MKINGPLLRSVSVIVHIHKHTFLRGRSRCDTHRVCRVVHFIFMGSHSFLLPVYFERTYRLIHLFIHLSRTSNTLFIFSTVYSTTITFPKSSSFCDRDCPTADHVFSPPTRREKRVMDRLHHTCPTTMQLYVITYDLFMMAERSTGPNWAGGGTVLIYLFNWMQILTQISFLHPGR